MKATEFTQGVSEEWSKKYKDSINCSNPKGFSQRAHCAGRKKNEGVAEGSATDSELKDKQQFALRHYGNYTRDPAMAFDKWVQRSLMHSELDDEKNAINIQQLQTKVANLEKQITSPTNNQGVAEGDKIGNMDADAYTSAMARLKQLAGSGPLKTVYDPATRRYKNVPTAVQPVQQPKKK
jgi:hypothetical protein